MSLTSDQEQSIRVGPLYRVVRISESMTEDIKSLAENIKQTKYDREQVNQILRARLREEHPGKLLIVGNWGYRTTADGKGLDRIPVVFSEDLSPPSPRLTSGDLE